MYLGFALKQSGMVEERVDGAQRSKTGRDLTIKTGDGYMVVYYMILLLHRCDISHHKKFFFKCLINLARIQVGMTSTNFFTLPQMHINA